MNKSKTNLFPICKRLWLWKERSFLSTHETEKSFNSVCRSVSVEFCSYVTLAAFCEQKWLEIKENFYDLLWRFLSKGSSSIVSFLNLLKMSYFIYYTSSCLYKYIFMFNSRAPIIQFFFNLKPFQEVSHNEFVFPKLIPRDQ